MNLARICSNVCHPIIIALIATINLSLLTGCGALVRVSHQSWQTFRNSELFWYGRHGPLDDTERQWANVAWRYIKNNTDSQTGLINSQDQWPIISMANIGHGLAALHSAYQLKLIDDLIFDKALSKQLHFLNIMPLLNEQLPNRFYHTETGEMISNVNGQPGAAGWSGQELGQLLIWLNLFKRYYPAYAEYIDKAILRWDFCKLISPNGDILDGQLEHGMTATNFNIKNNSRLGTRQYAAYGYQLWGFDVYKSEKMLPLQEFKIYQVSFGVDGHDPRIDDIPNPLLTTPFFMSGILFNWDSAAQLKPSNNELHHHSASQLALQSRALYQLQEARFTQEGIHTARAAHVGEQGHLPLYDAIWALGSPFPPTITSDGKFLPKSALVSTQATFLMWALWKTAYTDELMLLIEPLYHEQKGWFEGRYEHSGGYQQRLSLATNSTVLSALLYKDTGPLVQSLNTPSHLTLRRMNEFKHPEKCHPKKQVN
ncbi:MAG: DUF3131 domain-containing protein [Ferrimonas sp.]